MDRWLDAVRLGVLASLVRSLPFHHRCVEVGGLAVARFLESADSEETRSNSLSALPSWALKAVARAAQDRKLPIPESLVQELRVKALAIDSSSSPIRSAEIWAYHCLFAEHCDERRLLKLGRDLWKKGAAYPREAEEKLRRCRFDLWEIRSTTQDRCVAAVDMVSLLRGHRSNEAVLDQIENILLHHQFAWPLLVFGRGQVKVGGSLPFSVDVVFDDGKRVSLIGQEIGEEIVDAGGWIKHLERARRVAVEMWQWTHRNHGPDTFDRVGRARVIVDLAPIVQVLGKVLTEVGLPLTLDGGSAEAHFSQVVLHNLLGRRGALLSAVTGMIGARMVHKDGRTGAKWTYDYLLKKPAELRKKARYVFTADDVLERLVVPAGSHVELKSELAVSHRTEVLHPANLRTLADIVQPHAWRQCNYVRCPDVAWGIHSGPADQGKSHGASEDDVAGVLDRLRESQETILTLENYSARAIAGALRRLNMSERLHRPSPPPLLSWVVLRAVPYELEVQFWSSLLASIGAPPEAVDGFFDAHRRDRAVRRLAAMLNQFEPKDSHPFRCPDLLVILNSRVFEKHDDSRKFFADAHPYLVNRILEELGGEGCLSPCEQRWWPLIGRTRVLLIRTEREFGAEGPEVDDIPVEFSTELERLSVLRWGFTASMASALLPEHNGSKIRHELLHPLREGGFLREGQGLWHIPESLRQALVSRSEANQERSQELHYRAACALTPQASPKRFPTLALDHAFSPWIVHEALWHLKESFGLTAPGDRSRHSITWKERSLRLFDQEPNWGGVHRMLKVRGFLGSDVYEYAKELLEHQQRAGVSPHPWHLCAAGDAACQRAIGVGTAQKDEFLREAEHYYRLALDAAEQVQEPEKMRVATLARFAMSDVAKSNRKLNVGKLCQEVLGLVERDIENGSVIGGEFYEYAGDLESDLASAETSYRLGTVFHPKWQGNWVKKAGVQALMGTRVDPVPSQVVEAATRFRGSWGRSSSRGEQRARAGLEILVKAEQRGFA